MIKKILAGALLATVAITAVAPVASAAPSKDVVQKATQINKYTRQFDTLLAAVGCFTLPNGDNAVVDLLKQDGITLFAPTDRAFKRFGRQVVGLPLKPNNVCSVDADTLLGVLAYHVYDKGAVDYRTALGLRGNSIQMAIGDTGEFAKLSGKRWRLRVDGERVIIPNIKASNGIIHVTRGVLNPLS